MVKLGLENKIDYFLWVEGLRDRRLCWESHWSYQSESNIRIIFPGSKLIKLWQRSQIAIIAFDYLGR